jgi:uncharacterized protein YgiB involved in biofilm formation
MTNLPAPKVTSRTWSSKVVAVSLFSVSGVLAGCDSTDDDSRRNQYQTQAECKADYSEKECEPQARAGGGFFFLGPIYRGNWRSQPAGAFASGGGPGRAAMMSPNGVVAHPTQTARGGFGTTGRSYSSRGT